ncbi:Kazal-like serine protease inhibitor [Phytophthora megakarya]|uniref:Kazal-like serine protease inhibitor n=1 Tax=Phytophthora megakarya TaxID=4795 RepID=A0A225WLR7_9STRA|nr:Kazal-like serine protease inhibitor [Phytophthora megakarya]
MKVLSVMFAVVTTIGTVNGGNPNYLRTSGPDGLGSRKEFDFSDVNQDDQINQSALSLDGSGSDCPEKCPLNNKPVEDEDGVEYRNECVLRLAQCSGITNLASSDMEDVSSFIGSFEGTIEISGSGSKEAVVVDIGLLELFGKRSSYDDLENGSALGGLKPKLGRAVPAKFLG